MLRLPAFLDSRHIEGGKVVSPMYRPPLPPGDRPLFLIFVRGWLDARARLRPALNRRHPGKLRSALSDCTTAQREIKLCVIEFFLTCQLLMYSEDKRWLTEEETLMKRRLLFFFGKNFFQQPTQTEQNMKNMGKKRFKVRLVGLGLFQHCSRRLIVLLHPNNFLHSSPEAPCTIQARETSASEGKNYYQRI